MRWYVYYAASLFLLALFACSCASDNSNSRKKDTNLPPGNVTWPPEVSYLEVTPERVLDLSYDGPITLTFTFSASASHAEVIMSLDEVIPLTRINDYVWTHDFSSRQILRTYIEGEPVVRVGVCNYYGNDSQQIQYNLSIPVRSDVMPDPRIIPLDSDMQMSDHVLNIRHDTIYLATMLTGDFIWRKSKDVFKTTLSPKDIYAVVGQVQAFANRSAGGDEMSFPCLAFFDLASAGTIHELGHCLGLVNTNHRLLRGWDHWLPGNAANGIMGWSTPQIKEGLQFRFRIEPGNTSGTTRLFSLPRGREFNELELYKLGLLPRNRVSPVLQFSDPDRAVQMMQDLSALPSCGENCRMTYIASEYVTIDDIIESDGQTGPATKKDYSIGTVVLSHGRLLTPNELAYFEHMAARGESRMPVQVWSEGYPAYQGKPLYLATRGLMTLSTRISPNDEMSDKYPIDTFESPPKDGSYCYPPATPLSLHAKATSDSTIRLSWEPVSQALLYRIYRSETADGPYSLVDTTMSTQGTHSDTGLPDNTAFHYLVTAVGGDNGDCESDFSGEAEATTFQFDPDIEWIPQQRGRQQRWLR